MKKRYIVLSTFIILLIIGRLLLPGFITDYVNKTLDEIEGYQGSIADVDLNLYRGAYVIKDLNIEKISGEISEPFVAIKEIDLSIEWKAIFDGAIVGEIIFQQPKINFIASKDGDGPEQTGKDADWTKPLKELMPLKINRLQANAGKITFQDFSVKPKFELYIDSLMMDITNLSNVINKNDSLPTAIKLVGRSIGDGVLDISGKANLLKQVPDFDSKIQFTDVNLVALNKFFNAYGNFDTESGNFNVYSEIVVKNSNIDGYLKPFIENMKILKLKKDIKEKNVFQAIWEGVAGLFSEAVENQSRENLATKIPLKGNISSPDTNVFSVVLNVLKHAFIDAYEQSYGEAKSE
ncbi:MAG: DUF748 domain-containing protein [Flammeovirgaceae bacterium]|nr:DUF748 domain-containing protein [Flammeovirgaceae bacterium]